MVKTKNKKLKRSARSEQNGVAAPSHKETSVPKKKNYSADELLEKAETLMGELQFELAEKFCEKALKLDPENESAFLGLGEINLETGNLAKANEYFLKAAEMFPDSSSYAKYLQLGQLNNGKDSQGFYLKAVDLMEKEAEFQKKSLPGASCEPEVTSRDISEVYCALAELYMTDLCEESDAESSCEGFLNRAVAKDPENPSAFQTLASFFISAGKTEEAKEAIGKSVGMWLPRIQEAMTEPQTEEIQVECDLEYEKRKECIKILTELEKYDVAESVLDTLLAENDQDSEVWYLYGWMCNLQGEERKQEAKAYLQKAKEIFEKSENMDSQDEMFCHIESLLEELKDVPNLNLNEDDTVIADGDFVEMESCGEQ